MFLLLATMYASYCLSQTTIIIGNSNGYDPNLPYCANYNHTYTQQIYTAAEIIAANGGIVPENKAITKIAFKYLLNDKSETRYFVNIQLENTTCTSFHPLNHPTYLPTANMLTCFNGTLSFAGQNVWNEITLQNPFVWDGVSNIVVVFYSTAPATNNIPHFATHTTDSILAKFTNTDNYAPGLDGTNSTPFSPTTTCDNWIYSDYYPYSGNVDTRNDIRFTFEPAPLCPGTYSLTANVIDTSSITLNWYQNSSGSNWELIYGIASVFDTSNNNTYTSVILPSTTSTPYIISNLNPNTSYSFTMRQTCGGEWSNIASAKTLAVPVTLPYFTDFTNTNENEQWQFLNFRQLNKWYIGAGLDPLNTGNYAVPPTSSDNNSLYISNDGGITNTYTGVINGISSKSYAYRDIYFPNGTTEAKLSFDWRAKGNAPQQDFLRIYLMPLSENVTAGTIPSGNADNHFQIGNFPAGTGVHWLSNVLTWQHEDMIISTEQTAFQNLGGHVWRLYFHWRNENTNGIQQSPAAVDNISISVVNCERPTNITVSSITDSSAILSFTGASTQWIIQYMPEVFTHWSQANIDTTSTNPITLINLLSATQYKARIKSICANGESNWSEIISFVTGCGTLTSFPYTENFDSYSITSYVDYILPLCWIRNTDYSVTGNYRTPSIERILGNNLLSFRANHTNHFIAIAPPLDNSVDITTLRVKLKMRYTDTIAAYIRIGIMTDPNDWTTFVGIGDTLNISTANTWEQKEIMLNTYSISNPANQGKYIAFASIPSPYETGNTYIWIDDIEISEIPSCPDVYNFTAVVNNFTEAILNWNTTNNNSWIVAYSQTSADMFDTSSATLLNVNTTTDSFPYIISNNLLEGETYSFAIRSTCGGTWTNPIEITLPSHSNTATLPYFQNFENNTSEWNLYSNSINTWFIGNATGNTGKSLYITNDGGNSYAYSHTETFAIAWARVSFDTGFSNYNLAFDWKCKAQDSIYDRMEVYLFPISMEIPTSWHASENWFTDTNIIKIGEAYYDTNNWVHENFIFNSSMLENTMKKLVFMFYCNYYDGENPPAAVDNIYIAGSNCSFITNMSATDISFDSAIIHFSDSDSSHNTWEYTFGDASTINAPDENNVFSIASSTFSLNGLNSATTYNVWVRPFCYYEGTTSWGPTLTFTTQTSCPTVSQFEVLSTSITSTSAQISFQESTDATDYIITYGITGFNPNDSSATSIDVGDTSSSNITIYQINGLTPATNYDVYVQSNCGIDRSYRLLCQFTTKTCEEENLCQYTFFAKDGYGDGWDDGFLVIKQNGLTVDTIRAINHYAQHLTVDTFTVNLCPEVSTELFWYGGIYFEDIAFDLISPTDTNIFSAAAGSMINFTSNHLVFSFQTPVCELPFICEEPTAVALSGTVTPSTATITWTPAPDTYLWQVKINNGDTVDVYNPYYTFNNLEPNVNYFAYVRSVCGNETYSNWVNVTFSTPEPTPVSPEVRTDSMTFDETCGEATFYCFVLNAGYPIAAEFGILIGTDTNLTIDNGSPIGSDVYLPNIIGYAFDLDPNLTYYFNAFARTQNNQYIYGTSKSFSCNNISDVSIENVSLEIFPNPASKTVVISVSGLTSNAQIIITDLTGKTVYVSNIDANNQTKLINVKNFNSGVYSVRLLNNEINKTSKLIITKNSY
jgi:hypothetical protein